MSTLEFKFDIFQSSLDSLQSTINNILIQNKNILSILSQININTLKITHHSFSINSLRLLIQSKNIHTPWSIIELTDNRIATGGGDGSITISSLNYIKRTWSIDIHHLNAHNEGIQCLCEITKDKLASSSKDKSIKIWKVLSTSLIHLDTLIGHNDSILKIISHVNNNIIISCSKDKSIKLWKHNNNSDNKYQLISSLQETNQIASIIQLTNNNDILICPGSNRSLSFWNINTYIKEHSIHNVWTSCSNGLIEFSKKDIILVMDEPTLYIVDSVLRVVINKITDEISFKKTNYISSLCLVDDTSMMYVCNGKICQLRLSDYKVMFTKEMKGDCRGEAIITTNKGKYIIINNSYYGFTVFENE